MGNAECWMCGAKGERHRKLCDLHKQAPMLVVGFGYKARQGKNTAALAMLNATPMDTNVSLYAFADALRSEVQVACGKFGGPYGLVESFQAEGLMPDWVKVEEGKQRSILQWWGTDWRRSQDPDYWVKRLQKTLQRHSPEVALVTDVRFPNEVAAIQAMGGVVVKVERTSEPDIQVAAHPSETALDGYDGWDYSLTAATKAELQTKAATLYERIARRHVSLPGS